MQLAGVNVAGVTNGFCGREREKTLFVRAFFWSAGIGGIRRSVCDRFVPSRLRGSIRAVQIE
jgi:hypothetical protein